MGLSADFEHLADEHRALVGRFGQVQKRCSELVAVQAAEIERLRGELMRLRAEVIARDTALAYAREDRAALEASLVAAELVICQAGCVSHSAYWRAQDHCRRTGKRCVLVAHPGALETIRPRR